MMVIYLPVKFEFDWTKHFRVKSSKKEMLTDRWNYTNFKSKLAMMVIHLPVKFEFDGQSVFELEFGNGNIDRQTNRHNYTNLERNLAMMVIYLPVKFEFD